jgi:hypothetical protein
MFHLLNSSSFKFIPAGSFVVGKAGVSGNGYKASRIACASRVNVCFGDVQCSIDLTVAEVAVSSGLQSQVGS